MVREHTVHIFFLFENLVLLHGYSRALCCVYIWPQTHDPPLIVSWSMILYTWLILFVFVITKYISLSLVTLFSISNHIITHVQPCYHYSLCGINFPLFYFILLVHLILKDTFYRQHTVSYFNSFCFSKSTHDTKFTIDNALLHPFYLKALNYLALKFF